jgi:hypothetical protein
LCCGSSHEEKEKSGRVLVVQSGAARNCCTKSKVKTGFAGFGELGAEPPDPAAPEDQQSTLVHHQQQLGSEGGPGVDRPAGDREPQGPRGQGRRLAPGEPPGGHEGQLVHDRRERQGDGARGGHHQRQRHPRRPEEAAHADQEQLVGREQHHLADGQHHRRGQPQSRRRHCQVHGGDCRGERRLLQVEAVLRRPVIQY